jgi:hypothetical protein
MALHRRKCLEYKGGWTGHVQTREKVGYGVKMKRIFAASVIAAMLPASGLAMACEISCAFASSGPDCLTQQSQVQGAMTVGTRMGSVFRVGISMPRTHKANSATRETITNRLEETPARATLADISIPERQTCDQPEALAVLENCPTAFPLGAMLVAGFPHNGNLQTALNDGCDDIAHDFPEIHSPPNISLRI